ncbi:MAG: hypothetical protein Q8R30_05775 [bacterium]|nr:hypothetical protein [bacterium]MDZ4260486.1 hypothetical protein [Candidatus Sungbacteria bacterium]
MRNGFSLLVVGIMIAAIFAIGGITFYNIQDRVTPFRSGEELSGAQKISDGPSTGNITPVVPTVSETAMIPTPSLVVSPKQQNKESEIPENLIQKHPNIEEKKPEQQQTRRDPKFEEHSQRLYTYGIDCTHENAYSMRNAFAIDPSNPNIMYAGIEGRGVYKSVNKGLTWKKIIKGLVAYPDSNNLSELCFPDIAAIYIDSANTQRLLMVTSDITTAYVDWPYGETGGIWESVDGGESWRQMLKAGINVAGSGSLLIDPKNSQVMYYPVNPDPPTFTEAPIKKSLNIKSSVYKTVNGGKTWEEIDMPMLPGLQALVTAIDPKDSNHLLFFTQSHDHIYGKNSITEVFLHKQYGVLESFDAGNTWIALGDRLPAPYRALFDGDVSRNNFNHMVVRPFLFGPEFPPESTQQKSFYSIDGGKTFEQTPIYIWIGRYDPHDKEGNHLFGYAPWQGWVVESRDAGKTWLSIGSPEEVSSYNVKISNFVWDPKESNIIYMSGDYGNIWQSANAGKTWKNILNLNKLPK